MANPSSPKKRRTDDGTVTADAIAQSNSTLQIFLGQGNRQNRWMQGYVPPSTNTVPGEPAVNVARKKGTSLATSQGNRENYPNAEGATGPTDGRARGLSGVVNVVNYESPSTASTTAIAFDSTTTSQEKNRARSAAQPGLPSPAASDENTASPIIGTPRASHHSGNTMESGPRLKRGRPPSMSHGHPSALQTGSPTLGMPDPAQVQAQQHAQSSSASMVTPNRFENLQTPAPAPPNPQLQQVSIVLSQPLVPAPQPSLQVQDSMLSQMAMIRRFQAFRNETSKLKLNNVDTGRLTLLGEAIDRGDLFHIVLSQIHALKTRPDLIPDSAKRALHPQCFQFLDYLICSTDMLSDIVRSFLQKFPAQIMRIYFSEATLAIYEPMVRQVTEFLKLLPEHWDRIITESRHREAPPLVEDLYDTLHLPSAVFQTTAFRAIARLVLDSKVFTHSEQGINRLQVLHKMDQMLFAQHGRRSLEDKSLAYRAFRITKHAWKEHEPKLREYERQHPNGRHKNQPGFMFPPDAFAAFQQPIDNSISPAVRNATQHQITPQQQASLHPAISARSQGPQQPHHFVITPEMRQRASMVRPPNHVGTPPLVLPAPGFIFPREGELPRAQPTNPDPVRSALHQAHLRSPTLGPVQLPQDAPRLYRHVDGFALSPKKLNKDLPIQMFTFDIPKDNFEKLPVTIPSQRPGEPPSRSINELSHTYRLRCASYASDIGFPTESAWVVADNCWPENLFLAFNAVILEPRRKLHHGRYLPIDLTHLTKPGENTIKIIANRTNADPKPFEYVIAVEIVGVTSHESIKEEIQTIDARKTSEAIQKSLSSGSDDDDLAVTSSNLTIKLFDPYSSSKIFDIPVRGSACVHKDCFDLETFLSMCKREKPGWPTVVDCWRCPLCRGDVRPQTLVIDGFLVEVRKELEKRKLLHTRAIIVEADGSWKPKPEEKTGVRSPSLEREERSVSGREGSASASKKVVEIIEID